VKCFQSKRTGEQMKQVPSERVRGHRRARLRRRLRSRGNGGFPVMEDCQERLLGADLTPYPEPGGNRRPADQCWRGSV